MEMQMDKNPTFNKDYSLLLYNDMKKVEVE